jgi:hypothetical protein
MLPSTVVSRIFLALAILLGVSAARAADADTPSPSTEQTADEIRTLARERFAQARAAFESGNHRDAALLFEDAYRLSPHASAMFNAAVAWDGAQEPARAADAYEVALDLGGLAGDQAAEASTRLAALKKALGYIRILDPVGATATVAHLDRATIPVRVHVAPGSHRIAVETADGRRSTQTVTVGGGQVATPQLDLEAARPEPVSKRPAPAPAPPADRPEGGSNQATWGWVALGGSVALSAVAVVLGVNALGARDDFEESARTDTSAHDRAATFRTLTNVAWGGAAVTGGLGLYFVLSAPTVRF